MPIMRSAVLSGSHSDGLVPDPHNSVPESGHIEILATHVSHHYFVWVCFIPLKFSAPLDISAETNSQMFVYLNVSQHSKSYVCLAFD